MGACQRKSVRPGGRFAALAAAVLCAGVAAVGALARPAGHSPITVYAAASLTDALPAVDKGDRYSFAGSNTLAAQIANGAPADVFASANTSLPAQLYAKGVVEKPVLFTRNALVIVVPRSNPAGIRSIRDLTRPGVKVDVANSAVPVGAYTLEVLHRMGLASKVLSNVVSQETDVRAVLSKIELGEADAGFVYSTDARSAGDQVREVSVPSRAQPTVAYSIAVVTRSPNQAAAHAFVNHLLSAAGQDTMQKFGFLPVTAPKPTIARVLPARSKPGAVVTIVGTNLASTTSVTFHGVPATFRVVSAGKLRVTIPVRARTGAIAVSNPAGTAMAKNYRIT